MTLMPDMEPNDALVHALHEQSVADADAAAAFAAAHETPPKPETPPENPEKPEPEKAPEGPGEPELPEELQAQLDEIQRLLDEEVAPAGPAKPEPSPTTPARTKDDISELTESDDPVVAALAKRVQSLTEKLESVSATEDQRAKSEQEALVEQGAQDYLTAASAVAKDFGLTEKQVDQVSLFHMKLMHENPANSVLGFDEVARRLYGADALDAMRSRAKGASVTPKNGSPTPPVRTATPIADAAAGGGGSAPEFNPGPGRDMKDITKHLLQTGEFSRVLSRS